MASLVLTIRETLRYKGALGQWSWVLHRLTGLGVVLFLFIHVIDTAWAVTDPVSYEKAIASYQSPLFTIGEFGLLFAVIYHALNGLRIAVMDFKPEWWKHQEKAAMWVFGGTALVLIPYFAPMIMEVIAHYSGDPDILPLGEVIGEQVKFGIYAAGGAIAAGTIAFLWSALRINVEDEAGKVKIGGSGRLTRRIEKFWWSFMRVSGVLIIPLVFGHLAMMHVLQGVFDLTLAGSEVVGTQVINNVAEADALVYIEGVEVEMHGEGEDAVDEIVETTVIIPNGINESGTATEFVAERWNYLWNGVLIWKYYDAALLILVTMHGFNGLRLVLTDYTMDNRLARTTVIVLTVIGGVALIVIGVSAFLLSVDNTTVEMAIEASRNLYE
ncbi:MAG: succinate dehydrogenase, cytochrome b556 subunit [Phototrophicaceae bacterium]